MKLLHTADWHLGDRLGRVDRSAELQRAVERIAQYCEQEAVDVLLIAGDIFSELPRSDGLRESIAHLQMTFAPFFRRGGTIVACTGNHDNEGFCRTLRHAMGLAAPSTEEFEALVPTGRLYLADMPSLLRLPDTATGGMVQFILMPYPAPTAYFTNEVQQKYANLDERKRFLQAAFSGRLAEIRADPRYDQSLPTVLVAHVNVQGAQAEYLFHLDPLSDIVCPADAIANDLAYVVLGHIHKPHHLPGRPSVRYCGSLERLDLGEANDRKGVVVFEITQQGLMGEPVTLPLNAVPIYEVAIHDPAAELPILRERYPDHEQALVKLSIRYTAGRDSLETILRELDAIFPRWYAREWTECGELGPAISAGPDTAKGFEQVVRDYLDEELAHHPDDVRTAVLARAERLLRDLPRGGAS